MDVLEGLNVLVTISGRQKVFFDNLNSSITNALHLYFTLTSVYFLHEEQLMLEANFFTI